MNWSKVFSFFGSIGILLLLVISCSDENSDVKEVSLYEWKESQISPDGLFSYAQFEIGDDGHLYVSGSDATGGRAFYKYTGLNWMGNTWTKIGQPILDSYSNLETLKIYHGSVYYHVFNKLYKIEGEETTEILTSSVITSIELYKDRLIIIGEDLNVSNESYSIVSYDGATFEPLSNELALGRLIPANDKLYVQGYPGLAFDGQNLNALDFFGYFFNVDREESIYFGDALNSDFTLGKKSVNGEYETVGKTIHGIGNPRGVLLYDGTIILIGGDDLGTTSYVYYLNDERWVPIPINHVIYDVVVYNNRLLSISMDGKIYELVNQR